MITLKELTWSNVLSYQDKCRIQLDKDPLTQLVGDNGAGKTTIPIIIQEIMYGKNTKNIKKQDLVNRHSGVKGYKIILTFQKDNDTYDIDLDRKTTIKLQLYKNGENISSHKSLDTYKQIAEIIGISDFKTFAQLVYQSSTGSLEFLTATDTNRKRFLISLLQLEKYIELHELFKVKLRKKSSELSNIEGKIDVTEAWIMKNERLDLTEKELLPVPDSSKQENILKQIGELEKQIENVKSSNQKIVNNNQYIVDIEELSFDPVIAPPPDVTDQEIRIVEADRTRAETRIKTCNGSLKNLNTEERICPSCKQTIPASDSKDMELHLKMKISELEDVVEETIEIRNELVDARQKYLIWKKDKAQWEKLLLLIDKELPKETYSKSAMETSVGQLKDSYNRLERERKEFVEHNNEVSAHNAKVIVIKEQLEEYTKNLEKYLDQGDDIKNEADLIDVLKKIFSTNGLVSYKIESSVKSLEQAINEYLAEFSYFQIFFKLEKDKLNIQVIDEAGEETTVEGLSAGELGRVNIATVLAIRKIMSSLTSTEVNFLFLDEIVGVLDSNGKEKLVEILLRENLNTFIVAHEFDHPLVPKLHIVKENNRSRIEDG
jgi:DNA repair exonuclease SbcCD ATPase subunit